MIDGYPLKHAVFRYDVDGKDVTDYMVGLLQEDYPHKFTTRGEFDVVRKIKEQRCFVSKNFDKEKKAYNKVSSGLINTNFVDFTLPDGEDIIFGDQVFRCPEIIFQPKMIARDFPGISHCIHKTIMKCEVNQRRDFFNNILLAGGNTKFRGFADR